MMSRRRGWAVRFAMAVALAGALAGCSREEQGAPPDAAQQQAWATVIAGHTTGVVSRGSGIRVLFSTDVSAVDAAQVLAIKPAIAGSARFAGARELVFDPAGELSPGQISVEIARPSAMMAFLNSAELVTMAEQADARLQHALSTL